MAGPSGPGRVQKEGETDETGRVEFGSLPAGVYNVVVRSSPSGFVRPISSESIQLKDGEAGSQTIRLLRGGVISGRIVDETGDPLSRVSVRAIAKRGANGLPQGSSTGMPPITDDRGEFRIYGLAPGDYFVAASVFSASMGDWVVPAHRAEDRLPPHVLPRRSSSGRRASRQRQVGPGNVGHRLRDGARQAGTRHRDGARFERRLAFQPWSERDALTSEPRDGVVRTRGRAAARRHLCPGRRPARRVLPGGDDLQRAGPFGPLHRRRRVRARYRHRR